MRFLGEDAINGPSVSEFDPRVETLLSTYRDLWADLNAINAFIADLEARKAEIKSRQRHLANQIAQRTRTDNPS